MSSRPAAPASPGRRTWRSSMLSAGATGAGGARVGACGAVGQRTSSSPPPTTPSPPRPRLHPPPVPLAFAHPAVAPVGRQAVGQGPGVGVALSTRTLSPTFFTLAAGLDVGGGAGLAPAADGDVEHRASGAVAGFVRIGAHRQGVVGLKRREALGNSWLLGRRGTG